MSSFARLIVIVAGLALLAWALHELNDARVTLIVAIAVILVGISMTTDPKPPEGSPKESSPFLRTEDPE